MANPRLTKVKAKNKKARKKARKENRSTDKNVADIFASSMGSIANIVKKRRLKKKKS